MIHVAVNNVAEFAVPEGSFETAVRNVLQDHEVFAGDVSIAIVDDATIHRLNRKHLEHDYPTDVLSFLLDRDQRYLEGEVVVSADTAASNASDFGWPAHHELLLYVVHGTLHLVGYDDRTPHDRAEMRRLEAKYLRRLRIELPETQDRLAAFSSDRRRES